MKRLLITAALGAALALAPSSASAIIGNTDMTICNSVNSATWIWPHVVGQSWTTALQQGQCGTYHNNTGQLRVGIPGESYKYGPTSSTYGACKNGPWDSDPPNSANGGTEVYKTYSHDC